MCIFLAPTYACTKWITESTRCTLDHFGWGPFLEQQQSGIAYGAMTRACWKKLLSKVGSDYPKLSQIIPELSQISVPNLLSSSENSCHSAGGHLTRAALQALPGAEHGLVRKYVDKRGKRRHVGVPDRLRSSQCLDSNSALQLKLCCVCSGVYTPQIYIYMYIYIYIYMYVHVCVSSYLRSYTPAFGQCIARLATAGLKAWVCCKWKSDMFIQSYEHTHIYAFYVCDL